MFLDIFIDVVLLSIVIGGSYLGYQKGALLIASKPIKPVLAFYVTLFLNNRIDYTKMTDFVIMRLSDKLPRYLSVFMPQISIGLTKLCGFTILFLLSITIVSLGVKTANLIISIGIIDRINKYLGLAITGVFAVSFACVIVRFTGALFSLDFFDDSRLFSNFDGGLLYKLFDSLNSNNYLVNN